MGDIIQALRVPALVKAHWPDASVDWCVREEFAQLLEAERAAKHIDRIFSIPSSRKGGGIWQAMLQNFQLIDQLKKEDYTHVYDAHNSLRSLMLRLGLLFQTAKVLVRSKERWKRFLLFRLRINRFPRPYIGRLSYSLPLKAWGIPEAKVVVRLVSESVEREAEKLLLAHGLSRGKFRAFVPAAAWKMKTWPLEHWEKLVHLTPGPIVVLGGPQDLDLHSLKAQAPERVVDLVGKLTLAQSAAVLKLSQSFVAADTGLLHMADAQELRGVGLQGPSAFGGTGSDGIATLGVDLPCRPCSKDGSGKCSRAIYQECMVKITPESVRDQL